MSLFSKRRLGMQLVGLLAVVVVVQLFVNFGFRFQAETASAEINGVEINGAEMNGAEMNNQDFLVAARSKKPGDFKQPPEFAQVVDPNNPMLMVPKDLQLDRLAKHPGIANPLYLNFDERGRLWVVEYRQYPWPAGLKLVTRDKVWRNVYSPPFQPPPPYTKGEKVTIKKNGLYEKATAASTGQVYDKSQFLGKDRITILEDTNGDGKFDTSKKFLDGLNFCTAALKGRGGVYVLSLPYLLFYADKNNDDIPDSKTPQILLSGFGIEDSHAVVNSLRWGPDGWIYATQGSTVSGSVRRHAKDKANKPMKNEKPVHSMGQGVWRYHPEQHKYEVFAEGGGNSFGVEFDAQGRLFSGTNQGNIRGYHYVQGAYYRKNFTKHGALSNPYVFQHIGGMIHPPVKRFTHTLEVYESTELPKRYHGKIFGVAPHTHYTLASERTVHGATFKTDDIAHVIDATPNVQKSKWFTPVDIQTGPDGALYIADWYSVQSNHYRNHEGQTNPDLGYIYRLRGRGNWKYTAPFDLRKVSSQQLVTNYLSHTNRWYRETALRLLGDRRDAKAIPMLTKLAFDNKNSHALEAFWALNLSGGFNAAAATKALQHKNEFVRCWAVRLIGDHAALRKTFGKQLVALAKIEPNVEVRCQLACTARRMPVADGLPITAALVERQTDAKDQFIPLLLWWNLAEHANNHEAVLASFKSSFWWTSPLRIGNASLAECLMRRWAMVQRNRSFVACGKLLALAPAKQKEALVGALTVAFKGQAIPNLPENLTKELSSIQGSFSLLLQVRQNQKPAITKALTQLKNNAGNEVDRLQLIQALGDVKAVPSKTVPLFLGLIENQKESTKLKTAALSALKQFSDPQIAARVIASHKTLSRGSWASAELTLVSRTDWVKALLKAIDQKKLSAKKISGDAAVLLRFHQEKLDADGKKLLATHFPAPEKPDYEAEIKALVKALKGKPGNPKKGELVFHKTATCGKCHTVFAKGGKVGPDLTSYNRSHVQRMLLAIVNPTAEIREGFETYTIRTEDGIIINGFKVDGDAKTITIRDTNGQNVVVKRADIDAQIKNRQSLMPEGLLQKLTLTELRDLFAFLASTTPPK